MDLLLTPHHKFYQKKGMMVDLLIYGVWESHFMYYLRPVYLLMILVISWDKKIFSNLNGTNLRILPKRQLNYTQPFSLNRKTELLLIIFWLPLYLLKIGCLKNGCKKISSKLMSKFVPKLSKGPAYYSKFLKMFLNQRSSFIK